MENQLGQKKVEQEPVLLSEVEPIEGDGSVIVAHKEDLAQIIELPLLSACEELYDKNIETWQTSANKNDLVNGEVYIIIVFDSLSPQNQEIAKTLNKPYMHDGRQLVKITIPVSERTTVLEIKEAAQGIANKFEQQEAVWIPRYTPEDMRSMLGNHEGGSSIDELKRLSGFFYDDKENLFYRSEDHYQKINKGK